MHRIFSAQNFIHCIIYKPFNSTWDLPVPTSVDCGPGSSVGIATGYVLDGPGV